MLYKEREVRLRAVPVTYVIERLLANTMETAEAWLYPHYSSGRFLLQLNGSLVVTTENGKRIAAPDDMLVQSMVGELSLLPTTIFNALYKPAGD